MLECWARDQENRREAELLGDGYLATNLIQNAGKNLITSPGIFHWMCINLI